MVTMQPIPRRNRPIFRKCCNSLIKAILGLLRPCDQTANNMFKAWKCIKKLEVNYSNLQVTGAMSVFILPPDDETWELLQILQVT